MTSPPPPRSGRGQTRRLIIWLIIFAIVLTTLLVAQAVIVALGALPAFWLGRRWLGDDDLYVVNGMNDAEATYRPADAQSFAANRLV